MIEYKFLIHYFGAMKRIVLSAILMYCFNFAFSQISNAAQDIDFFSKSLKIQGYQEEKLKKIIDKKYLDLEKINKLRTIDEKKYREKRRNVVIIAERSIRLILNEKQIVLWQKYKKQERIKNGQLISDLQKKGANKEDILDAQYGIIN